MKLSYYLKHLKSDEIRTGIYRLFEKRNQRKSFKKWLQDAKTTEPVKSSFGYNPLISIILPVYNVNDDLLVECIESVISQSYPNWELCIADDASTFSNVKETLSVYKNKDSRIKVIFREKNGHICKATNTALKIATGEFIAFLDNDDLLTTDALSSVVEILNKKPTYDFLYSDEDKIQDDLRFDPAFKPEWSPQLLLSTNYTSHFSVFRKKIVDQMKGLQDEFIGAQDYDFVLRFTERISSNNIIHIPKILYHWRVLPSSTASNPAVKSYANEAGKRALQSALDRRGIDGIAKNGFASGFYKIDYQIDLKKNVTLIYAIQNSTKNLKEELQKLATISAKTKIEIFFMVPDSFVELVQTIKNIFEDNFQIRIITSEKSNLLSLYNEGARYSTRKFLFFLNSVISIPKDYCIDSWLGLFLSSEVASISGTMIDKRKRVLSSGWYLDSEKKLTPIYNGAKSFSKGYFGRLRIPTNIAVGEKNCCMIKKEVFNNLGGFDTSLIEDDSIVEFFLNILKLEYSNVCIPTDQFKVNKNRTNDYEIKNVSANMSLTPFCTNLFKNNEYPL